MVATSAQRPDPARPVEPLLVVLSLLTLVAGFEAQSLTGRRPRSSLGRFGLLRIEPHGRAGPLRSSTISRSWRLSGPLEELADAARETQAPLVAPPVSGRR